MSQSILVPSSETVSEDWDADESYDNGLGGSVVGSSADGESLITGATLESSADGSKGSKKKRKGRKRRSAIYALLKECRLIEFEQVRQTKYGRVHCMCSGVVVTANS